MEQKSNEKIFCFKNKFLNFSETKLQPLKFLINGFLIKKIRVIDNYRFNKKKMK